MLFSDIIDKVKSKEDVIVFKQGFEIGIESKENYSGIPKFLIKIKEDLQFEVYHIGTFCCVTTRATNIVTTCKYCSTFD